MSWLGDLGNLFHGAPKAPARVGLEAALRNGAELHGTLYTGGHDNLAWVESSEPADGMAAHYVDVLVRSNTRIVDTAGKALPATALDTWFKSPGGLDVTLDPASVAEMPNVATPNTDYNAAASQIVIGAGLAGNRPVSIHF